LIVKKIKLGSCYFLVVDLMKPLSLDQEVYPGDPKPKREVFTDIEQTGWHHYIHRLADHHFQPHGDAPNHQNPDMQDKGIEVFGLEYSFNSAFMIDLTATGQVINRNGISFVVEITLENLLPYKEHFSEKEAVLLRTGYDRHLEKNFPHDPELLPYLTADAAAFVASFKNIKVVGTDSMTVDPDGVHTAHQLLKEKLIVESLVHLHAIPREKRDGFYLQTTPVRIVGATGAPVTAYAFIE
jgi:kynurenine formamidase